MAAERTTGKDTAEALASFANDYGADIKGFVEEMHRTHRTLQQGVGRIMVLLIKQWAGDYTHGCYDGRNEAVCKMSAKIVENWKDFEDHLPLI